MLHGPTLDCPFNYKMSIRFWWKKKISTKWALVSLGVTAFLWWRTYSASNTKSS